MKDILSLKIAAKPEYISAVRMFISAVAARLDFTLAKIEDIRTAVSEGCTLAMRSFPEEVLIDVTVGSELYVSINAQNVKITEENEADEFSLMLIRAMADELSIRETQDKTGGFDMVFKVG